MEKQYANEAMTQSNHEFIQIHSIRIQRVNQFRTTFSSINYNQFKFKFHGRAVLNFP